MTKQNVHLTGALGNLLKTGQISSLKDATTSAKIERKPLNHIANLEKQQTTFALKEVDPKTIRRWSEKDRPENELGNIQDLAKSFKQVGQQVPCIVRPIINDNLYKYELIAGECRWKAADLAKLPLKVIVQDMDDHKAALIQAVENEKRTDLSEYAKGMSYANKIEKGILAQKDLIDILGISKQQVSRLLSFRRIPANLTEAIGDLRKISARTSEELCRLSSKGFKYLNILIDIAPDIATGKYGHKSLKKEIDKRLNNTTQQKTTNNKVIDADGRHLFTWRLDNNATPSIHFPKDILKLMSDGVLDKEQFTEELKGWISKRLTNLKSE